MDDNSRIKMGNDKMKGQISEESVKKIDKILDKEKCGDWVIIFRKDNILTVLEDVGNIPEFKWEIAKHFERLISK